ncbi:MAG: DUF3667 domain-containing protein [Cyclobacteriaceae bacterium]
MTTCKNCANSFEGNYCPNCSQKADTHRFSVKHFAHEVFHAFTHADKGIFFLAKELFVRPGKVAREFNEGKRKKYFNPITYLLLVMALQIYLTKKTDINTYYVNQIESAQKADTKIGNDASYQKLTVVMNALQENLVEHGKLINCLFIPIMAFLIWMMFRKSEFNYAEVLVLTVMYIAHILLLYVLVCIIPFVLYHNSVSFTMNLYILLSIGYIVVALKQFYQQGWWKTILKSLVIQVLYYIVMSVAMLAVTIYLLS